MGGMVFTDLPHDIRAELQKREYARVVHIVNGHVERSTLQRIIEGNMQDRKLIDNMLNMMMDQIRLGSNKPYDDRLSD